MPELPEVETIVRDLKKSGLEGRRFQEVHFFWPRSAATPAPDIFKSKLEGRTIVNISRRAKFLVLQLAEKSHADSRLRGNDIPPSAVCMTVLAAGKGGNDMPGGWLLIHLRMTGRLDLFPASAPLDPYTRIQARLDDGRELRFKDIRKFGRWYFYEQTPPQFSTLGPEPLSREFTWDVFRSRVGLRSRRLKPLLLDQTVIAGLGNIYVDESLWEARLHPLARADRLNEDRLQALHGAIVRVLERGIRNSGTTLGTNELNYYSVGKRRGRNQDELKVFRRTGQPCLACGGKIVRMVVGQRSTHLCPKCQRKK